MQNKSVNVPKRTSLIGVSAIALGTVAVIATVCMVIGFFSSFYGLPVGIFLALVLGWPVTVPVLAATSIIGILSIRKKHTSEGVFAIVAVSALILVIVVKVNLIFSSYS